MADDYRPRVHGAIVCRFCRKCVGCEPSTGGHRIGCPMLCPTCLTGTLREWIRSLFEAEQRRYSCGCRWTPIEALAFKPDEAARQRASWDLSLTTTRQLVAGFLREQPTPTPSRYAAAASFREEGRA